ncbi:MAG: hypothetical protein JKY95_11690 [Planctomycetaceae bacterium]|nr:hypothetical protein [Planctomycetaceae bacterium]
MPLPEDTIRSLERLKSIREAPAPQVIPLWKKVLLKADGMFLFLLILCFCSLSVALNSMVNDQDQELGLIKEEEKAKEYNDVEINLGNFEALRNSLGKPGFLSIIEYKVTLSADGNLSRLIRSRRLIGEKKNRLRSVVEVVINNATSEELEDPELTSIKSSILKKLQDVVGLDEVTEVMFPRFGMFDIPLQP